MPEPLRFPNVNRPLTMAGRPLSHWAMAGGLFLVAFMFLESTWQKLLVGGTAGYIALNVMQRLDKVIRGSAVKNILASAKDPTRVVPQKEVVYPPPYVDTSLILNKRGGRRRG